MRRTIVMASILVLVAIAGTAIFYTGEELTLRRRIAHATDTVEAVTIYDATRLKSGRYEVFRDQPKTELCVHTVLPHLGHRPCWYVRRTRIRVVG